jgi:hypothetical protein
MEIFHASGEAGVGQIASPFVEPGVEQGVTRVKENGANVR